MLNVWLGTPDHSFMLLAPPMNELLELLDEELLIGEKPTNTWELNGLRLSGIEGTVFFGTGDYYMELNEEEYINVQM